MDLKSLGWVGPVWYRFNNNGSITMHVNWFKYKLNWGYLFFVYEKLIL